MRRFEDRTALVTGAASGMGFLTAQLFHEEGAHVVMLDINADTLRDKAAEIGCDWRVCNVREYGEIEAAVRYAEEKYGAVEYTVSYAGGNASRVCQQYKPFHKMDLDALQWGIDVNFRAPMYMARAVLDGMIARHFNQITELGKMLDPLADKLTQGTVAICIAVHYPSIWPLLALLVLKELVMLCGACYLLKNGKKPCAAKWYGKVSTTLFYIAIGLIVVMDGFMKVSESTFNIASTTALVITAGFMVYTFIRYFGVFREILRSTDGKYDLNLPEEMRAKKERTPKN